MKCNSLFEEDVVLRAHPHGGADGVHVSADVASINVGCARCGGVQASQDGPGHRRYQYYSKQVVNAVLGCSGDHFTRF